MRRILAIALLVFGAFLTVGGVAEFRGGPERNAMIAGWVTRAHEAFAPKVAPGAVAAGVPAARAVADGVARVTGAAQTAAGLGLVALGVFLRRRPPGRDTLGR